MLKTAPSAPNREVRMTDSLPKGPTGKILRREVKISPEADQA